MGGLGSGRRPSYCGKSETHDSMPLDIRKLARQGLLVPGRMISSNWTVNDRAVASISIQVDIESLVLSYKIKSTGEVITQRVAMQVTPCRLGGYRHWFACPHCSRRVAVLYGAGKYFSCRHCSKLGYPSQKEGQGDRASRQADKIRARLHWEAGILNGAGGKPKGMHWKTYYRLKAEHDGLLQVSFRDIARRLGFLDRVLMN